MGVPIFMLRKMSSRSAIAWLIVLSWLTGIASKAQSSAGAVAPSSHISSSAQAHVGRGFDDLKDLRYREAADEFKAALALDSGLVDARFQLGVCYFAIGRRAEARAQLEGVHREVPNDRAVLYYLARLDLVEGNPDSAIRRLEGLMVNSPFPDSSYYLGSAYLKKGDLVSAKKWLQKAAKTDPRDFRVPDHLARVYQKQGQSREAEREYARSAEVRQHYDEGATQATNCSRALETGPLEQARPICRRLFVEDDPDKLTTLAMLYGQYGDFADAVEPLEQAARLDAESFEVQHNLGLTYFRLRQYERARGPLAKAVEFRPDFFGSNALLGATLYALKQDAYAYAILDPAHQLNPEDADTADLLFKTAMAVAQAKSAQGQYAESLKYLRRAEELRPADPEVQHLLSQARADSMARSQ